MMQRITHAALDAQQHAHKVVQQLVIKPAPLLVVETVVMLAVLDVLRHAVRLVRWIALLDVGLVVSLIAQLVSIGVDATAVVRVLAIAGVEAVVLLVAQLVKVVVLVYVRDKHVQHHALSIVAHRVAEHAIQIVILIVMRPVTTHAMQVVFRDVLTQHDMVRMPHLIKGEL